MRKIKFIIPLLILFLTIGFAAVNFSLSINGDTEITGNLDNFNVYFSRALVNGEDNNSIVSSKTQLDFSGIIDKVGNTYTIEYDVTNASTVFDAEVSINCTPSSEYLLVQNTFDTSNLSALETRTGTLELKKLKTISNDSSIYKSITCDIVATPVERESEVTGSVVQPLDPVYIGREVSIGTEKFNVISSDADSVTMLAKYNLGTDYRQSSAQNNVIFRNEEEGGWVDSPGPQEVDRYIWGDSTYNNYIDEYLLFLKNETNDYTITGDSISVSDLIQLGCTVPSDYSLPSDPSSRTCLNSLYGSWLINGQYMWTRSAVTEGRTTIWVMYPEGALTDGFTDTGKGIRPAITVSRELYTKLISSSTTYQIGREVSIGDEKFNIISDNGLTVTMLAKYNLGTDYRQSTTANGLIFSDSIGWEETPGPKEVDIQIWTTNPKIYVNEYVSYLQAETGDSTLSGDLITLLKLKSLGCDIVNDTYILKTSDNPTCLDSPYYDWLVNGQSWWTKSAIDDAPKTSIGNVAINGDIYMSKVLPIAAGDKTLPGTSSGIRPVITISKDKLHYAESLKNYEID